MFLHRSIVALAAALALAHASRAQDWPTFGGGPGRDGVNAAETVLSPATVPGLVRHWVVSLPGDAPSQPAFLAGVSFPAGTQDELYIGTMSGDLFALNAATGATDWHVQLPSPAIGCRRNHASVYGISATPTIDRARGLLYTVTTDGNLHALGITTGAEAPGFPLPVIDAANLAAQTFSHASPLEIGNMLYITTGASCEKPGIGAHGQVIAVDLNAIAVVNRFYPMGDGTATGGGIWGPGGLAAEADGSVLYGATANADGTDSTAGLGEHVLALTPSLTLTAANLPPLPPVGDIDFGSTPVLMDVPGCPPLMSAINKSGLLFLYDRTNIANGPLQTLQVSTGNWFSEFIGAPAFDATSQTLFVANPVSSPDGLYPHGIVALQVNAQCQLTSLWQQLAGSGQPDRNNRARPPVVANGVVWLSTGSGRELAAFDEVLGTPLWNSMPLPAPGASGAPLVANGQVFVAVGTNQKSKLFAFGL